MKQTDRGSPNPEWGICQTKRVAHLALPNRVASQHPKRLCIRLCTSQGMAYGSLGERGIISKTDVFKNSHSIARVRKSSTIVLSSCGCPNAWGSEKHDSQIVTRPPTSRVASSPKVLWVIIEWKNRQTLCISALKRRLLIQHTKPCSFLHFQYSGQIWSRFFSLNWPRYY